jgi:hypothetical protein
VSVAVPAAAAELAVMVTFCGVPGVRLNVEGLAVTPAGSPLMAIATVPVNLLTAPALTVTVEPAAPAVRLNDVGETAKVKSGVAAAAAMVRATFAEWLSVPEVLVKVSVAFPAAVEEAAVRVTCCAVPGVRVSIAGLAVTPAGSPLSVTATRLEKPLTALAVTEIGTPVAPAVRLNDAGAAVRVKSPAGAALAMVRVTLAEWLRLPDVPDKVRVALPAAAVEAAVIVTFWAVPGVRVNAAGVAVTPAGRPVRVTATVPENPLTALAITLIGTPAAPAVRLRDAWDAVSVKSGPAATARMVRATCAEWLKEPDVPDRVRVALPAKADEDAVIVTC